ncbi:MAG TPA: glycosyltransferase family 39 protein [Steroidobacteraceae bacterium]
MTSRLWIVGLALALLAWFAPLGAYALFNPDEGRYAEIPREMVASGDWVTPRLDAIKYFEKPPLQYWATAGAFEVFGAHEWTTRLWGALCGAAGIGLAGWLARRLYGPLAGALAAALLGGSLLYAGLGHLATLDMGLCFALQLAMTGLALLAAPVGAGGAPRAGPWLLAAGVTGAFLAKGLIGLLIPGVVALLYILIRRDWRLLLRAQPWWSVLALAVLAAPWVLLVSHRNPEFAHFFFIHEHFQRYLSTIHDRYEPPWFFVPILLAGVLPWTTLLPAIGADAWRHCRQGEGPTWMLALWAVFVFVFFSASQSKLIPYIVPMLPALAVLGGRTLAALPAPRVSRHLLFACVLWMSLALLIALIPKAAPGLWGRLEPGSGRALHGLEEAFLVGGLLIFWGVWLGMYRGIAAAVMVSAFGTLVLMSGSLIAAQWLPRMQRTSALIGQLEPVLDADTDLYCVGDYEQSIPFYLRRPCTLVRYRGELDFGLQQEPQRWLADLPQFVARWRAEHDAVALLTPADYSRLQAMGAPMHVIYTSATMVAVSAQ